MAKATTIKVKLVSSADTGFYYVTRKNSRTMTDKLVTDGFALRAADCRAGSRGSYSHTRPVCACSSATEESPKGRRQLSERS